MVSYNAGVITIHRAFIHIVACVLCARPATMMLERVISVYELLCSGLQTSFCLETLNDIMAIRINGPPVAEADLRPVIAQFIDQMRNRPVSLNVTWPLE